MKAIIIEDESLSADHLKTLLKRIDKNIEVIAIYESVKQSVDAFKNGISCDLLFVDIHLADGLSFEIFSKVAIETPVIFTTAYDDYAIKAFKLNSIDYLLKPIGIDDLKIALNKYKKINHVHQSNIIEDITNAYQTLNKNYKSRFMVKIGDSISSIKTEEITHFISEDGIVLLAINGGKRFITDYTLDILETLIDPQLFFRINRKVIVNINSINKVSPYFNSRLKIDFAGLEDADTIISRDRVTDFKHWLDK
jgi:DNA-binding LytR/AlgR family response regulator